MIVLQILITFICLLYIAATLYAGYKSCIELEDWSIAKVMFNITLFILNLISIIILFNIWTI